MGRIPGCGSLSWEEPAGELTSVGPQLSEPTSLPYGAGEPRLSPSPTVPVCLAVCPGPLWPCPVGWGETEEERLDPGEGQVSSPGAGLRLKALTQSVASAGSQEKEIGILDCGHMRSPGGPGHRPRDAERGSGAGNTGKDTGLRSMGLTWQLGQAGAHPSGSPGHRHRSQALNQERRELLRARPWRS